MNRALNRFAHRPVNRMGQPVRLQVVSTGRRVRRAAEPALLMIVRDTIRPGGNVLERLHPPLDRCDPQRRVLLARPRIARHFQHRVKLFASDKLHRAERLVDPPPHQLFDLVADARQRRQRPAGDTSQVVDEFWSVHGTPPFLTSRL